MKIKMKFQGVNKKVQQGYSNKRWNIECKPKSGCIAGRYMVLISWGPVGSVSVKNVETFRSKFLAEEYVKKKVKQKLNRGYSIVK